MGDGVLCGAFVGEDVTGGCPLNVGAGVGIAVGLPIDINAVLNASKFTEPSPVTGSQPAIAENP